MRIISGTARGTKLETLEGNETRPTIDRVKEGIFSSIQFIIHGANILDLNAGSGQLGAEALSRGATKAVFVDQKQKAVEIIIKNLKQASLFQKSKVLNMGASEYLLATKDTFDIVFLDPPYNQGTIQEILPLLVKKLNNNAVVLCETEKNCDLPQMVDTLVLKKVYKYGSVQVTKYINVLD